MKLFPVLFFMFSLLVIPVKCSSVRIKAVEDKNKKSELWSVKMANSVLNKSDSLIWYKGDSKPKWRYDLAFLGQVMDKLGSYDTIYSQYAKDYIDYFVQEDGEITGYEINDYNLDKINGGKHLLTLYKRTGDEKYLFAIENLFNQILEQPKTSTGGFWHKKRYPHQMWLDGIYMASPFIAQYAAEFNKPELFDLAT